MTDRQPRGGRVSAGIAARMASGMPFPASESQKQAKPDLGATPTAIDPRTYTLWFPARPGPLRKRSRTVNGVKGIVRVRALELPPGPNGSRGNPIAHSQWVKDWRDSARHIVTQTTGAIGLERAAITVTVHRRVLGTADPDNDLSRCKPIIDGMRDAGLLTRDTYGAVVFSISEQRAGPDGPGISVIVREIA